METPFLERQSRFPLSNRSVTVKYALVHMCYWILVTGRVTSPDPDIFVAATPCDAVPRAMLGIPANLDCEMIKWRLTLRRDPRNLGQDDFQLKYTYGVTRPGTQGFKDDGFTKELSGK